MSHDIWIHLVRNFSATFCKVLSRVSVYKIVRSVRSITHHPSIRQSLYSLDSSSLCLHLDFQTCHTRPPPRITTRPWYASLSRHQCRCLLNFAGVYFDDAGKTVWFDVGGLVFVVCSKSHMKKKVQRYPQVYYKYSHFVNLWRDFIKSNFRSTRASRTMWTWTWWNVCCSPGLDLLRTEQMRKAVRTQHLKILLGEVVGCWHSLLLIEKIETRTGSPPRLNNNAEDLTRLASGWFLILDDSKGHTITVCIPDWADIFSRAETQNAFNRSHDIQPTDRNNSTNLFDFNHVTHHPSIIPPTHFCMKSQRDTLLLQKKSNFVSVHASCVHLGSFSVSVTACYLGLTWSRRCVPNLVTFHHPIASHYIFHWCFDLVMYATSKSMFTCCKLVLLWPCQGTNRRWRSCSRTSRHTHTNQNLGL